MQSSQVSKIVDSLRRKVGKGETKSTDKVASAQKEKASPKNEKEKEKNMKDKDKEKGKGKAQNTNGQAQSPTQLQAQSTQMDKKTSATTKGNEGNTNNNSNSNNNNNNNNNTTTTTTTTTNSNNNNTGNSNTTANNNNNSNSVINMSDGLPSLHDITNAEQRRIVLIKKLKLCTVMFDFNHPANDKQTEMARAAKRQNLIELGEYINQSKQFSDDVMPHVLEMLSKNLFRSLPPPMFADFDPDEDEPSTDPAWPHVQLVYDFLHKFVLSVDVKVIKKYLDKKFLLNLIDLFNSEDMHERDYLKMILHRIYGRCMPARTFIRQTINNVLFEVIYNSRIHHGISELLEILGSIINGFALPLKREHVLFLQQVLIPLHKTPTLPQFHQQLTYCITQFIQKDSSLASFILCGILKYWPATSCQKEVLFLQELEEVLQFTERSQIEKLVEPLFKRVANSICSTHFQVAERALFLWNNDTIATFTSEHRSQILPIIYPALQRSYSDHWNPVVSNLTLNIIRIFKEMDKELYESITKDFKSRKVDPETKAQIRAQKWQLIREHKFTDVKQS